ncbi:MAG: nucleotidyltransferase domain-containing protein [Candidatus Peribacteraceae bacterium]|nr:nucleotidyltransferase domain-containing protein [Candidatus Peribacteraceae bacterium]
MREANVVNMKFGSHLYGLNTPNSDIDYKGIFIPTLDELLLGNYPKTITQSTGKNDSKNVSGDVDTEVISLPYFIKLACKGETMAMDMLHCTNPISDSWIWKDLVAKRTMFYSKNLYAFVGYVKRQASKYGLKGTRLANIKRAIKHFELFSFPDQRTIGERNIWEFLPVGEYLKKVFSPSQSPSSPDQWFYEVNGKKYQSTLKVDRVLDMLHAMYDGFGDRAKLAEKNEGVDWKAMSHAIRAACQVRDIYIDGDFEYPLEETDFILQVKKGELDYKTKVAPFLEELIDMINILAEKSNLPEEVNTAYWDRWLLSVYKEHYPRLV